jgi:RNase adaptor protein for sRNA GlmZ degradation
MIAIAKQPNFKEKLINIVEAIDNNNANHVVIFCEGGQHRSP